MPIYEFRCAHCDYLFEKMQSHSAEYPPCPVCGSVVDRIMSAAVPRFKGKGFHCTDYTRHGVKKHISR